MNKKIQIVFPKHNEGVLAESKSINLPPPLGALTLSLQIRQEFTNHCIEVFDCNTIPSKELPVLLDGDIVGISVVFSNYKSGVALAEKIKATKPNSIILMGGPNVNGIEKRILLSNKFVDFVFSGESEIGFVDFLNDKPIGEIPGIHYRTSEGIKSNPNKEIQNLDDIPFISLDSLKTPYQWKENVANNSAFPISGIRGCNKINRCDYCSIPSKSVRRLSPQRYWEQLFHLYSNYGITRFFETGDVFDPKYAKALAKEKPFSNFYPRLRIYSYPGMINENNIEYFKTIGVDNVFIGIESLLLWQGRNGKIQSRGNSIQKVVNEIELLYSHGITTMPSFILGLPGENLISLKENIKLIEELAKLAGVNELLINTPFPLPGSNYFEWCNNNPHIVDDYFKITGQDLRTYDQLDYPLLSHLFIKYFTKVPYQDISNSIKYLKKKYHDKIANWGIDERHKDYVWELKDSTTHSQAHLQFAPASALT